MVLNGYFAQCISLSERGICSSFDVHVANRLNSNICHDDTALFMERSISFCGVAISWFDELEIYNVSIPSIRVIRVRKK